MSIKKDNKFFNRFVEAALAAWNDGNLDALDEFLAPDYRYHQSPFPDLVGREAYKGYLADVHGSYPDGHLEIKEWIFQGDMCASRGSFQGTQTGVSPSTGAPPTGKEIYFVWGNFVRFDGDKAVEGWAYNDNLTLMQQLGVVKMPETT